MRYKFCLVVTSLLVWACAPRGFHSEETERLVTEVDLHCEAAQEEVRQLTVLLENLQLKPQDAFLIAEYDRHQAIYTQKKQLCFRSIQGRDSALTQMVRDWQESRQDIKELSERERLIQERIFLQKQKPKDSLQLME